MRDVLRSTLTLAVSAHTTLNLDASRGTSIGIVEISIGILELTHCGNSSRQYSMLMTKGNLFPCNWHLGQGNSI